MGPSAAMTDWLRLKAEILAWTGVDRDALLVFAALLGHLAAAAVLRLSAASLWPWLCVLAVVGGNEAATVLLDGRALPGEIAVGMRDVWIAMAVPTLLMLVARIDPKVLARTEPVRIHWQQLTRERALLGATPEALDAEYVDLEQDELGNWAPSAKLHSIN